LAIESAEYQEKLSKATTGLAGRVAEIYKKVCPTDGVALREGKCPVCARQIQPSGPNTANLSEPAAKQSRLLDTAAEERESG
jgi:hypothetical protein